MTPINEDITPFGEAFGVNPDGSSYEAPEDTVELDEPDVEEVEEVEEVDGVVEEAETEVETPAEKAERLYAGKYKTVEELEKGYDEANKLLSRRQQAAQTPEPEAPPAPVVPLFKGETAEIKTETDLYNWAGADPESAAMFVMQNHERIDPKVMDDVMNNWIAAQPWKATTTIQAWQTQMLREEFAEQRALADSHVIDQIRDQGIQQAIKDQPMLEEYSQELGEYIEANPHLNQMVEGARTAAEVTNALHAIFYMMAGPRLSQQALEAQVAAKVKAEQAAERKAKREAEQAQSTQRATSLSRNTAPPPGGQEDDQVKALQDLILNPGKR